MHTCRHSGHHQVTFMEESMLLNVVLSPLHDPMSNHVARAYKLQIVDIDSINKTREEGCEGNQLSL